MCSILGTRKPYSFRWSRANRNTDEQRDIILSRSIGSSSRRALFLIGVCCFTSDFLLVIGIRRCSNGRVNNSETVGAVARPKITRNVCRGASVHGTPLSQPRVYVRRQIYARQSAGGEIRSAHRRGTTKRAQRENKIYSTEKKLVIHLKETAPYALSTTNART